MFLEYFENIEVLIHVHLASYQGQHSRQTVKVGRNPQHMRWKQKAATFTSNYPQRISSCCKWFAKVLDLNVKQNYYA